jgi:hypothetical protein
MSHPFQTFRHDHEAPASGASKCRHMGIFFHALRHDLSNLSPIEFWTSAKVLRGNYSPGL